MDLGVVLQTTPPSARVVDLARRAEAYGFTHVWTFDSAACGGARFDDETVTLGTCI